MKIVIVIFTCYLLGGYATTDILRLLKGNNIAEIKNACYCPNCNVEIPWYKQIPILSYFLNRGKCFKCGKSIPKISIVFETGIFLLSMLLSMCLNFSAFSFLALFLLYEMIKHITILIYKKREKGFFKEYIFSLLLNVIVFGFMYLLYLIVDKLLFFVALI